MKVEGSLDKLIFDRLIFYFQKNMEVAKRPVSAVIMSRNAGKCQQNSMLNFYNQSDDLVNISIAKRDLDLSRNQSM